MREKLNNITDIFYGPHHRAELSGEAKYLVASHFDDLCRPSNFKDSYIDDPKDRALLQEGDVIFTGKGHRFFAWAYSNAMGKAVPSSLFYVLRLGSESPIKSEYLAYYLNSKKVNSKLRASSLGTSLPSIQKKELANITIDIPSIEQQNKLIQLAKMLDEDVELTSQLLEKKKTLRAAIINKIINE